MILDKELVLGVCSVVFLLAFVIFVNESITGAQTIKIAEPRFSSYYGPELGNSMVGNYDLGLDLGGKAATICERSPERPRKLCCEQSCLTMCGEHDVLCLKHCSGSCMPVVRSVST